MFNSRKKKKETQQNATYELCFVSHAKKSIVKRQP